MRTDSNSIVHVSSVHTWVDNRIHYRECVSLVENGYNVTLVAVTSPVQGTRTQVSLRLLPDRPRATRVILSSAQAIALALRTRATLVHLHDPELIPYIPLLRAAGRKVIYDAHEDLPDQLLNKNYVPQRIVPLARVVTKAALQLAKTSHLVVCATGKIAEAFNGHPHIVLRNYPRLRPEQGDRNIPILERPNSVVYVGGISEARGARVMVDAVDSESFPKGWKLNLAGGSSAKFQATLQDCPGWDQVAFHGVLPPESARDLLLQAKIGLVVLADNDAYRVSLPTKMFEYFAAGLPVVASDFPLWRQILTDHECGLVVDPDSPQEVAAAVRRYAEDPDLLKKHSRNALRVAFEKFNWESESNKLIQSYRRLLNSRGMNAIF